MPQHVDISLHNLYKLYVQYINMHFKLSIGTTFVLESIGLMKVYFN